MATDWVYAKLSKVAKAEGGPEEYINKLEQCSKNIGKMEMVPWIGVTSLGASLLTLATIKMVDYFKLKKQRNKQEIEMAKQEIINSIEEYDAMQENEESVDRNK